MINLNDKESVTLNTALQMQKKGEYPSGFKFTEVKKVMPKLISNKLICKDSLKFAGVIALTDKGKEYAESIK